MKSLIARSWFSVIMILMISGIVLMYVGGTTIENNYLLRAGFVMGGAGIIVFMVGIVLSKIKNGAFFSYL